MIICLNAVMVNAGNIQLPATGETSCYDTSGDVISCTGTAQDGAYIINPISYTDNGNGTVTDNNIPVSVTNGTLNITFSSVVNYAKVSAIELQ
jgi:hypothetical protein